MFTQTTFDGREIGQRFLELISFIGRTLKVLVVMSTGSAPALLIGSAQAIERPPQYIAIAFDNCSELDKWEYWRTVTKDLNGAAAFTFFISGTNFLSVDTKHIYKGPFAQPGQANIDFSSSPQEIRGRNHLINLVNSEGSEIGSHAVGHFDGTAWHANDWTSELNSYASFFDHVADNNGLSHSSAFQITSHEVRGFRAPYLGITWAELAPALNQAGFRYDTSDTGEPSEWPTKDTGVWKFKLALIDVLGTGKKNLSMDYNFYVTQSGATENPANAPIYRQQMLDSYMSYFQRNYEGNRAPIHIGHHFADYQTGVYRQALTAFVRQVCVLPEVKCTTYTQLANFLDSKTPAELNEFAMGAFVHARLTTPSKIDPFANSEPIIAMEQISPFLFCARIIGSIAERFKRAHFEWATTGNPTVKGSIFDTSKFHEGEFHETTLNLVGSNGRIGYKRNFSTHRYKDRSEIVRMILERE
jgi:hypothetical protein